MRFSLLYKTEESELGQNVIYDLSIDRSIANITADSRRNDYFCNVLSKPLAKKENIEYRREILSDLTQIPGLFDALKVVFNRYDRLKSDWYELKSAADTRTSDKGSEVMLEYTYSSLKTTALFPKTILSFFQNIKEILSKFDISSGGLCAIRDYAGEMIENESLNEIVSIASRFMYNTPDDYDFELVCTLGDTLEVYGAQICSVVKRTKQKNNIFKNLVGKKKKEDEGSTDNTDAFARDDALFILGEALYRIDSMLEEITDSIYTTFYGIARELDFYDVAAQYLNYLKEHCSTLCMAEISEDGEYTVEELYDLFLLSEGKDKVYPNDFCFERCGALIRGKNNTGKTTFLRSFATAQLFTQAGLPIPAKRAKLPLFEAIFTHFSAAEEEFTVGDAAGRFEGEVRAMAQILNSLKPGSLVILNETFQTTAYDEGSRAMANILKTFVKLNCRFVFVTHLFDLFDMMGESVLKLESATGDDPFTIKKL